MDNIPEKYPLNPEKYPVNYLVSYLQEQRTPKLSSRQVQRMLWILECIQENQYNRQKLSEILQLSTDTIKKYIEALTKLKMVEFVGAARNGYYKVTDKLQQISSVYLP
ncbi:MAG: hypothetical protein K0R94_981 [Burkholderiales bacterium]|nr:hypothetical protein [Burkholderiales bacterium]